MSHVTAVDIQITDFECLKAALEPLGLELMEGQAKYHWYGRHVGDYPVPDGFQISDLGKCEHAIRVKPHAGLDSKPYEIGLVRYPQGTIKKQTLADGTTVDVDVSGTWTMLYDFFMGGYGLEKACGTACQKVVQGYAVEVAKKHIRKAGYRPIVQTLPNGSVQVTGRK